jgi:hypothetical protein
MSCPRGRDYLKLREDVVRYMLLVARLCLSFHPSMPRHNDQVLYHEDTRDSLNPTVWFGELIQEKHDEE